jgi:hypothetical protein
MEPRTEKALALTKPEVLNSMPIPVKTTPPTKKKRTALGKKKQENLKKGQAFVITASSVPVTMYTLTHVNYSSHLCRIGDREMRTHSYTQVSLNLKNCSKN